MSIVFSPNYSPSKYKRLAIKRSSEWEDLASLTGFYRWVGMADLAYSVVAVQVMGMWGGGSGVWGRKGGGSGGQLLEGHTGTAQHLESTGAE